MLGQLINQQRVNQQTNLLSRKTCQTFVSFSDSNLRVCGFFSPQFSNIVKVSLGFQQWVKENMQSETSTFGAEKCWTFFIAKMINLKGNS